MIALNLLASSKLRQTRKMVVVIDLQPFFCVFSGIFIVKSVSLQDLIIIPLLNEKTICHCPAYTLAFLLFDRSGDYREIG